MRLFAFAFVLFVVGGSEASLLLVFSGGGWSALVPMLLFVVPVLFAGVDLWHYVNANLFRRDEERSEFASLACGVAAWQVIIAPATVMLYAIYWSMPQMFSEIHSGFDCWRIAMAISIWHGFLSLPLLVHEKEALSIGYLVARLRRVSHIVSPEYKNAL